MNFGQLLTIVQPIDQICQVVVQREIDLLESTIMPRHPFSILLERKFLEWQIKIGERKSQAALAKLIGVSRTSLTMWMNGTHFPDKESVDKLADFFGMDIYDALDMPRPNPYLQKINQLFERLSPEHQQKLAEDAERYETNSRHARKSSKERKTQPRE